MPDSLIQLCIAKITTPPRNSWLSWLFQLFRRQNGSGFIRRFHPPGQPPTPQLSHLAILNVPHHHEPLLHPHQRTSTPSTLAAQCPLRSPPRSPIPSSVCPPRRSTCSDNTNSKLSGPTPRPTMARPLRRVGAVRAGAVAAVARRELAARVRVMARDGSCWMRVAWRCWERTSNG